MTPNFDAAPLNNPLHALRCLGRGFMLLGRPELRHFVWIPLALNLVLYALGFWAVRHYFDVAMSHLLPEWLNWLRWLLWPLVAASLLALTLFTFTLVANFLGAPFYGPLADKVAMLLGLPAAERPAEPWWTAAWRSMAAEGGRLMYYGLRALPLLVLFLIPGINILAPFLWLVFNGWFLTLEYAAYPFERQGLEFGEQRRLLAHARLGALGFGLPVALGLAVPFLNVLIPPAAVAGAVVYVGKTRGLNSPTARTAG